MDLVAGATGMVGKRIALRLREEGRSVRALVRGGSSRPEAVELARAGIAVAAGDLTRPETLAGACAGIETVLCTVTTMPHGMDDGLRRVDRDGVLALIDAAEKAGVERFVYVSYSGGVQEPSPLEEAKRGCERRLMHSTMDAAILRPSLFMEVWIGGRALDLEKSTFQVFGPGTAPVSYVSAGDVAEFAVSLAKVGWEGRMAIEIGGPEPVTQLEVAGRIEAALGRTLRLEHVPVEALRAMQASPDPLQSTFGALGLAYAKGNPVPEARETAERYGVRLRSVDEFARSLALEASSRSGA